MYECPICLSLNHNARLHCQNCGTIPAKYSWRNAPINQDNTLVVTAFGAVHSCKHRATRVNLKTVTLDYYAE